MMGTEKTYEEKVAAQEAAVQEVQETELDAMFSVLPEDEDEANEEEETLQGEDEEGEEQDGGENEGDGEDEEDSAEGKEEDDEEKVKEEEEEEPEEKEEAEDSEIVKLLKEQNEALKARLDALEKPEENITEEKEEEPPTFDVTEILTEEEYDETDTREGMNKALVKVAQKATEFVMKNQVGYITKIVRNQVTQEMTVKEFFKDNPDLVEHRKDVQTAYITLQSAEPGATMEQIFAKLPKTVRAIKGLPDPEAGVRKKKIPAKNKQNPANRFAKSGGSRSRRQTPEKPTGVSAEILAMEKSRR